MCRMRMPSSGDAPTAWRLRRRRPAPAPLAVPGRPRPLAIAGLPGALRLRVEDLLELLGEAGPHPLPLHGRRVPVTTPGAGGPCRRGLVVEIGVVRHSPRR